MSKADGCTALLTQVQYFPVDWILVRSDLKDPAQLTELLNFPDFRPTPERPTPMSALRRSVSGPEPDGTIRISLANVSLFPLKETGKPREEPHCEVEQVWHPNELWWRSFRRYVGGHINLEAVLVSDPNGSGFIAEGSTSRPSAPAGSTWTVGQEFHLRVKVYSTYGPETLRREDRWRVRVDEPTQVDGRECARLDFIVPDAPNVRGPGYILVVDIQTWSPVGWEFPKDHGYRRTPAEAEGYRALLPTTPEVPLDWVVLRSDLTGAAPREEFFHLLGLKSVATFGLRRTISAPHEDGALRIRVELWVPRRDPREPESALCTVEQVWHPGELWWRSFRRWTHGRLELEATRIGN